MHFAVNVKNEGTPVETVALENFGIMPEEFGRKVIDRFSKEIESSKVATQKVKTVQ